MAGVGAAGDEALSGSGEPAPPDITGGRRPRPRLDPTGRAPLDPASYHARSRSRGANPLVYWPTRAVLQSGGQPYFRFRRLGLEHVPRRGPVILASNHRSFIDPFAVGTVMRRPVYYVAKRELFADRLIGWWLSSLGAFPVDRGAGDPEAMATAQALLARGDCVLIFPEGTRVRPGPLGATHRGVGRLALETGAPVVPVAIIGTESIRRGWRIRPHKVTLLCGPAIRFGTSQNPSLQEAEAATGRVWECVMRQWEVLGGAAPATDRAPC